jgi:hypothetical protein
VTISDVQHLALVAAAAGEEWRAGQPYIGRFARGMQDAQTALRKILEAHAEDRDGLETALRAYLAEGPALDSDDYDRGGECVHSDVEYVLDGDRYTIADLLATITDTTEGQS